MDQMLTVLATAIASSTCTLGALWVIYRYRIKQLIREAIHLEIEKSVLVLERKLRASATEASNELLPRVREEVRAGAVEAGNKLIPRLRQEVREGLREAVTSDLGPDLMDKVARTGSSVVEAGLNAILRKK